MILVKYFLFECYLDGQLLFRSYSRDCSARHPRPMADEGFREIQMQAKKVGQSLTYVILDSCVGPSEARIRLKAYDELLRSPLSKAS